MRDLARVARVRPWHVVVVLRTWVTLVRVLVLVRRMPLPAVVARLDVDPPRARVRRQPATLSRVSHRALHLGRFAPRCLFRALVLFHLVRAQGDRPSLVIGLPEAAAGRDAHAWVEVVGRDVGPPPGRAGHLALVRYPLTPTEATS
jgi:hypothetical protein